MYKNHTLVHHQHEECEQRKLQNDLKKRLRSHPLNPLVETISEEESEMYEEITPKEHQASHKDCKDAQDMSQQD